MILYSILHNGDISFPCQWVISISIKGSNHLNLIFLFFFIFYLDSWFFMFNGLLNSSYEWIHEVIVVLNPNKSGMRVWFCIVWPSCFHRTCLNSQRSTFIPSELISLVIQILSFLESHWDFEIWVPWRSHGVFRFSFSFSSL